VRAWYLNSLNHIARLLGPYGSTAIMGAASKGLEVVAHPLLMRNETVPTSVGANGTSFHRVDNRRSVLRQAWMHAHGCASKGFPPSFNPPDLMAIRPVQHTARFLSKVPKACCEPLGRVLLPCDWLHCYASLTAQCIAMRAWAERTALGTRGTRHAALVFAHAAQFAAFYDPSRCGGAAVVAQREALHADSIPVQRRRLRALTWWCAAGSLRALAARHLPSKLLPQVLPLPCRLTSLPPNVLWHIARKMGRRSRTVSRALLDAYGPLDCGLVLPSTMNSLTHLSRMLRSGGQRLQHVTSLQHVTPLCRMLPTVAAKLPHLRSLTAEICTEELQVLAPLHSSLVALDVDFRRSPRGSCPTSVSGCPFLSQLTSLTSLKLRGFRCVVDLAQWQQDLGGLPQLERLSFFADNLWTSSDSFGWTPQLLASVRSGTPHMTHLSLGSSPRVHREWDDGDAAAMQQALVGLRSLSFIATEDDRGSWAATEGLVAVLSRCPGIESVHMDLEVRAGARPFDLLQLSSLRQASLHVVRRTSNCPRSDLESTLGPLPALSHLTKLELFFLDCIEHLSTPQLPSSLVELWVDGPFSPSSLLPPLQALPHLRVLGLHLPSQEWTPEAVEQLSTLTQLRSIKLAGCSLASGWVTALASLTALQELRLQHNRTNSAAGEDLSQLAPLCALTCLSLNGPGQATACGLLALLEALPNLRHLVLQLLVECGVDVEELVEGLLPRVGCRAWPALMWGTWGTVRVCPRSCRMRCWRLRRPTAAAAIWRNVLSKWRGVAWRDEGRLSLGCHACSRRPAGVVVGCTAHAMWPLLPVSFVRWVVLGCP
jgi:Leucine-rich repeat (LRR) protein